MALDKAALLEVLEAMQAAGVEDRIRTAAQTIYQALIDAELTAVIGAGNEAAPHGSDAVSRSLAPEVGWPLIPRRSKWARCAPLIAGVPTATAASAGPSPFAGWLVASLGVFAALRGIHALGGSRVFRRRRIERWALAVGWLLSVTLWTRASNRPAVEELPKADVAGLAGFLFVALVLAIPGAVPQVALAWSEVRQRVRVLSGRVRNRLASSLRRAW